MRVRACSYPYTGNQAGPPYAYAPQSVPSGYYQPSWGGYGGYYYYPGPVQGPPAPVQPTQPIGPVRLPAQVAPSTPFADDDGEQFLAQQHQKLSEAYRHYKALDRECRQHADTVQACCVEMLQPNATITLEDFDVFTQQLAVRMRQRQEAVKEYKKILDDFGPLPGSRSESVSPSACRPMSLQPMASPTPGTWDVIPAPSSTRPRP